MPNLKITAMPSLGGNQVPTDLVTAVDISAAPVNQNVKSTLNDLFAVITKNITDRAIRFQAPGSAPAVSSANQGALYHNGTAFLASSNGGAYEPVYTLSAQSAAVVFAGPTSGPAATPTFRALALTDFPQIATNSLLGRVSAGTGTPEQITSTAALLTWLQNPTSNNLSGAVTDSTGAGGALVFALGPTLTNPQFNAIVANPIGSGSNLLFTPSVGAVNHLEILNATAGNGPTIRPTGISANQPLNLASRGNGIISCVGNQLRVTGNTAAAAGILELRGGNASLSGGQIRLYEVTTNGTNYIGFHAPDSLTSNLLFELPATDGTAGQVLSTDGAGILSWATRGSGTVTSVGISAPPSFLTVANSPVTGSGTLALSLATQSAALVFAGPTSGPAATPTFRALALTDLPAGVGTVTSVGISAPPSFLTVANSPVTGSGTLALSLATQSAALVFAGPASGGAAAPTFRGLKLTDLPQIDTASLLGRSSAGTGTPEQITSTANILTWLQTPSSANLLNALTSKTGTGLSVFNVNPQFTATNNSAFTTQVNLDGTTSYQGATLRTDILSTTNSTQTSFGLNNVCQTVVGTADYGTINALQNEASHRGPGSIGFLRAANTVCFNRSNASVVNALGANYVVQNILSGTIDFATGVQASVSRGTGIIDQGSGFVVSAVSATTARGLLINSLSGSNLFGVFVNGPWTNVSNGGSTTWATSSDERYKTDIVDYERGLAEVLQYRPVRFTWNDKSPAAGRRKVGLLAQEAREIDPDLIFQLPPDSYYPDPLAMDAENITWQLVRAVQELHSRITILENA